MGERPLSNGERGLSPKPTLYQSRSHHAPSTMSSDFGLCYGRSAVGISFLGGLFVVLELTYRFLHRKTNFLGREIRVAGTCDAAWGTLFVPRKLSSSHPDFLILRESYFLGSTRASNERPYKQNVTSSAEKLGWRAPAVRLGARFLCRESFHPHTTIFLYCEKVTFSAARGRPMNAPTNKMLLPRQRN